MELNCILLVEDNEDDVLLMKCALEDAGAANPVDVVSSAEEAIRYLARTGEYANRTSHPLPKVISPAQRSVPERARKTNSRSRTMALVRWAAGIKEGVFIALPSYASGLESRAGGFGRTPIVVGVDLAGSMAALALKPCR